MITANYNYNYKLSSPQHWTIYSNSFCMHACYKSPDFQLVQVLHHLLFVPELQLDLVFRQLHRYHLDRYRRRDQADQLLLDLRQNLADQQDLEDLVILAALDHQEVHELPHDLSALHLLVYQFLPRLGLVREGDKVDVLPTVVSL